jgi:diketogulonate reductase-like aldo/keto reductase
MELRPFGSSGFRAAVIGQGTWKIDRGDRTAAVAALRSGLELGMTHIDTAEMYGDAEIIVGDAIAGRRDQVFLVSKVLPDNASQRRTVAACERSLQRLRTDRLDCYLLHWRGRHPLEETVAAFERLKEQGKILSWGVSNFDTPDLEEVRRIAGGTGPVCNQVLYHLRERAIEYAVIPWCEEHRIAVVAYSPLGEGKLPQEGDSAAGRVLYEIGRRYDASPSQAALAFLVRRPSLFAIPKASRAEHVWENASAGDLRLSEADIARIADVFPLGPPPPTLPML